MATFITSRRPRDGVARRRMPMLLGRVTTAAVTVVSALTVAAHSDVPFGHVVSLAFVTVTPAFAICGLLPDMGGVVAAVVGAAGSVAINALVVQTMLAVNAWSPTTGVLAIGLVTSALWLLPSAATNRPAEED